MWKLRVRLIPHIGPTMHYATLPFSFSRDHSAILEAAQTYCGYIGALALGVLRVNHEMQSYTYIQVHCNGQTIHVLECMIEGLFICNATDI